MSPELSQALTALAGGVGGVGLWRLAQYLGGRWFDERLSNTGDDADIRRSQAQRIAELEQRVDALQALLRHEVEIRAALEAEVRVLRDWCGPKRPGG